MVVLSPGDQLYKYALLQRIGGGSFGEVWLAEDRAVGHQYAVKVMNPGVSVQERLKEAYVGHRLQHANLVRIHNADVVKVGGDDVVLLVMDYHPHGSILAFANPKLFLPLSDALKTGVDILQGLEYLHGEGIYHNDVKPENVLVGPAGQAMLTDYGIVGIDSAGKPVDAPSAYRLHMAPEVIDTGKISALTDILQVGLTLYRLLCGNSCLRDKQATLGWQQYYADLKAGTLVQQKDFPDFVPPRVRRAVLKAMSPDPADRFQDPLAMRRELEKLSFPGSWTVDATGRFIGRQADAEYRFEKQPDASGTFHVDCYRQLQSSGVERRITRFCGKRLKSREADRLITSFMKFVVNGK